VNQDESDVEDVTEDEEEPGAPQQSWAARHMNGQYFKSGERAAEG
jgi:hypothetical protein